MLQVRFDSNEAAVCLEPNLTHELLSVGQVALDREEELARLIKHELVHLD